MGADRVAAARPHPDRGRDVPARRAGGRSGMTQNLPIGAVTSPHAVRLRRAPSAWLPRVRLHVVLMLAGVLAATAGAIVSAEPGPVDVRVSPSQYEIGGARLDATSP